MRAFPRDHMEIEMTEAKKDSKDQVADESGRPTVYTYPDGSQRVGQPPFPEKSPKEESNEAGHAPEPFATPMNVPQGYKKEGEPAPVAPGMVTADQFTARVEQKLRSDVIGGKDPETPNPTTASDKPELGGVAPVEDDVQTLDLSDSKDLDTLASKVDNDSGATEEQIKAAAVQIARETHGKVAVDSDKGNKTTKAKR